MWKFLSWTLMCQRCWCSPTQHTTSSQLTPLTILQYSHWTRLWIHQPFGYQLLAHGDNQSFLAANWWIFSTCVWNSQYILDGQLPNFTPALVHDVIMQVSHWVWLLAFHFHFLYFMSKVSIKMYFGTFAKQFECCMIQQHICIQSCKLPCTGSSEASEDRNWHGWP